MSTLTHSYHVVGVGVVDGNVNVSINDNPSFDTIKKSKEIGFVSLTKNGFHVEVYCFPMTDIYNELKTLPVVKEWECAHIFKFQLNNCVDGRDPHWRDEQLVNWKTILNDEMALEEQVSTQIVDQIKTPPNTFLVVFSDPHADMILLKTGLELYKRSGVCGLSLGDITGPRGDKWGQRIPYDIIKETRERHALELVKEYQTNSLFLLKGNHDNHNGILDVALVITTSKWQILFQHAFNPAENEELITLNREFSYPLKSEYETLASKFTIYSTTSEYLRFMHMALRSNYNQHKDKKIPRNCKCESIDAIEKRASDRIKSTLRREDNYNPFMFYGHEINAFNISSSIGKTSYLPMAKSKVIESESLDSLIDESKTNLMYRILPFDGEDGESIRIPERETENNNESLKITRKIMKQNDETP